MPHCNSSETIHSSRRRLLAAAYVATILGLIFTEFSCFSYPASAGYSEASSEAGTESSGYLRNRRGRYRAQQNRMMQQQRLQEARMRKQQQTLAKQNQQSANGQRRRGGNMQNMQIKSYAWKNRQGQGQSGGQSGGINPQP